MLEKKYIPLAIGGAAALAAVTLSVTCLCCGIATWVFPSRPRQPVAEVTPETKLKPDHTTITEEEWDAAMEAAGKKRAMELLTRALMVRAELPTLQPSELEFDQVGLIKLPLTVVQVVDERNALVRMSGDLPGRTRAVQGTPLLFWLTGAPTYRWVDDEPLELDGAFVVVQNRKYVTTLGAGKTVFQLRWIDPSLVEEARRSLQAEKRNP